MMSAFNVTNPLPRSRNFNNKVYDHVPRGDSKRVKSSTLTRVSSPSLSRNSSIRSVYRRKRSSYMKTSAPLLPPLTIQQSSYVSDSEFSFTSESSDLESLPDLVDDVTPISSPFSRNPSTPSSYFAERPILDLGEPLLKSKAVRKPTIFDIPEIVHKIIQFAALQNDNSPQERPTMRRRPLSLNHALLIHGSTEEARRSLQEGMNETRPKTSNVLYNCLQVNKLFYNVTKEILSQAFYFDNESQFESLVQNCAAMTFKPRDFKLYRLFHSKQTHMDHISRFINTTRLEAIELFMCPKMVPTLDFFQPAVRKLVICGSKVADDQLLIDVSHRCPNLEVLDVRGSEFISDHGIYNIGTNCTKLKAINIGRKQKGHLITDNGLSVLISNNSNLSTVGLAGCHVSDKTVWDLAVHCSHSLQRLSLNNCPLITNQSLPLILHGNYLRNLNVLELRFTNITNLKPMIEFKRRQELKGISMLIELCEDLCLKMRQQELEMDRAISQTIFKDIQDWANRADDGDADHESLLESRRWALA